jgi:ATP-dependent RNA helicase DeaD
MQFNELPLKADLLAAISAKGFLKPTEIQERTIPLALAGRDLIGQAKTGTGKTAAFTIPILNNITPEKTLQALVILPTRELAMQVKTEIASLSRVQRIHCAAVFGGQSINVQTDELHRDPQIVAGTPGRLLDLMRRGELDLSAVRFLVLDEADRMLDMGFVDDIKAILSELPMDHQTMLFSATMPKPILDLSAQFLKADAEFVNVSQDKLTVDEIDQYYVLIDRNQRIDALAFIIEQKKIGRGIVFTQTKRTADWLEHQLQRRRIHAVAMHGDFTQAKRTSILNQFKTGRVPILISTNLVARGLHIDDVTHIINFDFPDEAESYVHRIGRTARQGKRGEAITFCSNVLDVQEMQKIAAMLNTPIHEIRLA